MDDVSVLGKGGDLVPRYGLWLDSSPECTSRLREVLAEGWDFKVVLKWGYGLREIIWVSEYLERLDRGTLEQSNWLREIFCAKNLCLVKRT